MSGTTAKPPPEKRQLVLPMERGRMLVIEAPVPMSEAEFAALEATLAAWKGPLLSPAGEREGEG